MMDEYFDSVWRWFRGKDVVAVTKCLICGRVLDKPTERDHENGGEAAVCPCGFVWSLYQPTQKVLDDFYRESDSMEKWAKIKNSPEEAARQRKKYRGVWNYIEDNNVDSVLDVGCGNGFFLNRAQATHREGIEPSPFADRHCKFKTYKDYKSFTKFDQDTEKVHHIKQAKRYDLITMFGVLEHLKDPTLELMHYHPHLKKDGRMCIIVPNYDSLVRQTLREETSMFCPQHLWYFNIETLSRLMLVMGLVLDFWYTCEPETQPILTKLRGFSPYQKIDVPLTDPDITDDAIIRAHKGYKIVAFFKGVGQ